MKVTCGTDIIEIERIKNSIDKLGEKFLNKVFTAKEIQYCESKNKQKYQHYAARFAAKEAIFKALSTRIISEYSWLDFEVLNDDSGKPKIFLNTKINNLDDIDISISHCKNYAVATVIAIFKEK